MEDLNTSYEELKWNSAPPLDHDDGGSSLRDHRQADGTLGYFQHSFNTYDREHEPCRRQGCDGTIRRIVQSGRSTFYCPACQR